MEPISRRAFLAGTSFLPLASRLPGEWLLEAYATTAAFGTLTAHQAAVVEAATARLIPGPTDDPGEAGHPGAREAKVTRYIDTMLSALDDQPAKVFAGGPFSNRAGSHRDDMARFVALDDVERTAWKARLADLQQQYASGVTALDGAAGGDFTAASPEQQDATLAQNPRGFMTLLMQHSIEGMYGNPEYGGNAGLVGWQEIDFPGDSQPRGYTAAQVTDSDGPDPLHMTPVIQAALTLIASTAPPAED
ncbi:MAG: gluconate 2-dehydrogenase subunit 3 family protein [Candidatus Eisenbacteria bacterium]